MFDASQLGIKKGSLFTFMFLIIFCSNPSAAHADHFKAKKGTLPDKVGNAIEKGVIRLLDTQNKDGSWELGADTNGIAKTAHTALATYTLLVAKIDPKHEALTKRLISGIDRGFKWLKKCWKAGSYREGDNNVYFCGTLMMALEAKIKLKKKKDSPYFRYNHAEKAKGSKGADKKWMKEILKEILTYRVEFMGGGIKNIKVGYKKKKPIKYKLTAFTYDNKGLNASPGLSRTQYGALAMASCLRVGIKVDKKHLIGLLNFALYIQQTNGPKVHVSEIKDGRRNLSPITTKFKSIYGYGVNITDSKNKAGIKYKKTGSAKARGWDYGSSRKPAVRPYQGPTCAALVCLLAGQMVYEKDKKLREKYEAAVQIGIRDGIAWMGQNMGWGTNAGGGGRYRAIFSNYAIERVGSMSSVENFGNRLWYHEGCKYFVRSQKASGAWGSSGPGSVRETCFGVLFLCRPTKKVPFKYKAMSK